MLNRFSNKIIKIMEKGSFGFNSVDKNQTLVGQGFLFLINSNLMKFSECRSEDKIENCKNQENNCGSKQDLTLSTYSGNNLDYISIFAQYLKKENEKHSINYFK